MWRTTLAAVLVGDGGGFRLRGTPTCAWLRRVARTSLALVRTRYKGARWAVAFMACMTGAPAPANAIPHATTLVAGWRLVILADGPSMPCPCFWPQCICGAGWGTPLNALALLRPFSRPKCICGDARATPCPSSRWAR